MMKVEEDVTPTPEENGEDKMETDTSQVFEEIFGPKASSGFDSWEEFTHFLDEFQIKTGSSFKLKSASCVDYINEKRVNDQIPERFVYAKVKVICVHFGLPNIRGPGHRKSYVGKGCNAFMNVGYNKGALRISQTHLVHNNHPMGHDALPLRQMRAFTFNDELDLILSREIMKQNPFEFINGEKKWLLAVESLKEVDERFNSITPRVVKKRIRLLIDKFLIFSHGKPPVEEDELGNILYELDKTRKNTLESGTNQGHNTRKRKSTPYTEDVADFEDDEDYKVNYSEDEDSSPGRKRSTTPRGTPTVGKKRRGRPRKNKLPSPEPSPPVKKRDVDSSAQKQSGSHSSSQDLHHLVKYLQRKDEEDRKLRQQEIDLRKEELTLLTKQIDLQKERLEMDQKERKALIEYLQAQTQASQNVVPTHTTQSVHTTAATGPVTEYTILVDNKSPTPYCREEMKSY